MQNNKNTMRVRKREREKERDMLNCYKRSCDEAVCEDLNVIRSNAGDSQC